MFVSIAAVTVLSSILVFFSEEWSAYIKVLVKKPYMFLIFGLLLLSACMELYDQSTLLLVLKWWIGLLYIVQGLSYILGGFADQLLAKWIVVLIFSTTPVVIALWFDERVRRHSLYTSDAIKKRGYGIGAMLWISTVLLFVLGPPGSDFYV